MNTSIPTSNNDEWYTPKEIIDALGEFDLDPCAPMKPLWKTARVMWNKEYDGLAHEWGGVRVWCNPPYSKPLLIKFCSKMVENNNGILLLYSKIDNRMFQDLLLPNADAILFLRRRIRFYRPDGTRGDSPTNGCCLISFGKMNTHALLNCGIEGTLVPLDGVVKICNQLEFNK